MSRWIGVLGAVGVAVLALALPASAQTTPPTRGIDPAARSAAEAAITARLADLHAAVTLVDAGPAISASDRASLLRELGATTAGLQALATTITGETSVAAFRTEATAIYADYRVYALVLPQVRLVRASDDLSSVVLPGVEKVQAALQARIATAQRQGKNVAAAVADMADLAQQVAAIETNTSGVSATVLALTPPEWNTNHGVVTGPRHSVGVAYAAGVKAVADIRAARATLR